MANSIGQAYVQILPTTKDFGSNLARELSGDSGVEKSGKSLGGKLIKGLTMAGIGTAIVKGFKSSLSEGGELQQNLGGTEAVFGKFADSLQEKANSAYKNMGMSASEYMATANKMGSLFQGSGLSQKKSLDMTANAMQRAADVASVMGIDTQMAMESIAGAAKGNFTMMDNLGVAMNATTLQAYALEKGVNFNWKTASNAEKAEIAMQMFEERTKNMQGNFARESEQTLTGSLNAMKAVTQDLMGNLALGMDITPQISALLETGSAFLEKNLLPMIGNVITGLANNAGQLADTAVGLFNGIVTSILNSAPTLVGAGMTLITELGKGLIQSIPTLIPQVAKVVAEMAKTLTDPTSLSEMLTTAVDLLVALADGIDKAIPVVVGVLPIVIDNIVQALIKSAPKIILAIGKIIQKMVQTFKETNWSKIGDDIINGVVRGVESAKEKLLAKLRALGRKIAQTFKDVLKIGSPSKVMADLGKWIPIGLAVGIEKNTKFVSTAIDDMIHSAPLLSGNMTVSAQTSGYKSVDLYEAVRKGASEARPVVILNNRVLSRELKGMGVSFA